MAQYCVNKNAQANGYHEVHCLSDECDYLPYDGDRQPLGEHPDCQSALQEAKKTYGQSNCCYFCCNDCHTEEVS
ncbi:MAG: hypothetical protein COA71_08715 [SAR86 cluster bacterium]|uniref:Uncharacterized protein n=1 Tax=SAR86 cluster bacterium TaxID=2030880 RepID=A0A2A5CB93_9GAMM|nr:MAG: hypothetical protein COA71_08715 [SAR86 cluster bacterium]